jgi:hypothetical protein
MKLILFISSCLVVWLKLLKPGGLRRVAAENILLRKQLIVLCRNQKRALKLTLWDKFSLEFLISMMNTNRLSRIAIALKPATLVKFHKALVKRKYPWLSSSKSSKKPGFKGPEQAIIDVILEMKHPNPSYGYRRIAMQVSNCFGVIFDKDRVRRILNKHYTNPPAGVGSWLTFIGQMKDSLWSIDLFRCKSIHLKGLNLCCIFNRIISKQLLPKYLSSDNLLFTDGRQILEERLPKLISITGSRLTDNLRDPLICLNTLTQKLM